MEENDKNNIKDDSAKDPQGGAPDKDHSKSQPPKHNNVKDESSDEILILDDNFPAEPTGENVSDLKDMEDLFFGDLNSANKQQEQKPDPASSPEIEFNDIQDEAPVESDLQPPAADQPTEISLDLDFTALDQDPQTEQSDPLSEEVPEYTINENGSAKGTYTKADNKIENEDFILESTELQDKDHKSVYNFPEQPAAEQSTEVDKHSGQEHRDKEPVMFKDGIKVSMEEALKPSFGQSGDVSSFQDQLDSIEEKDEESPKLFDNTPDSPVPKAYDESPYVNPLHSTPQKKIPLNLLLLLLFVIIAVTAGYFFIIKKSDSQDIAELNNSPPPVGAKRRQVPGRKPKPQESQEKTINKRDLELNQLKTYFKDAEEHLIKEDLQNAKLTMILAEKIKISADLTARKNRILNEIKLLKNKLDLKNKKIEQTIIAEDDVFNQAEKTNTIEAYNKYLQKYPAGKFKFDAKANIEKVKREKIRQQYGQIRIKTRQFQRVQLRFGYGEMGEEEIKKTKAMLADHRNRFEKKTFNDQNIIIDYSTGLMWHLWARPMDYTKAKWWTTRRYAGLFNWRIPTVEEALSISAIDFRYFLNRSATNIQIWTGDRISANSDSVWSVDIRAKACTVTEPTADKYLFSCRKIQK